MKPSDTKILDALKAQTQTAEADKRTAQHKLRLAEEREKAKDARIAELESEVRTWQQKFDAKVEEISDMMKKLVGFIMGKGDVSLSESVKEKVIQAIREQYEQQLKDQAAFYEKEIKVLKDEIVRLKEGQNGGANPGQNLQVENEVLRQQNSNLRNMAFGQSTESKFHRHNPTKPADLQDLDGEETAEVDAPTITDADISAAVEEIKKKHYTGLNKKKPRRMQPLEELSNVIEVIPEDLPEGAVKNEDKYDESTKVIFVSGYVRIVHYRRHVWEKDGEKYQAKALPNSTGKSHADKTLIAWILEQHFVYHVTMGDIEKQLHEWGLNYCHGTVMKWIEKAGEDLKYIDIPLHDTICEQDETCGDESTIRVRDEKITEDETSEIAEAFTEEEMDEDSVEEKDDILPEADESDEHYFIRWLFCFIAPKIGLVQYYLHNRGRRTRRALLAYMKNVKHRMYLHSDGAPLYKCYDMAEFIIRVACLVHIRRPFMKLKDSSEIAYELVELFDYVFSADKQIKSETKDLEEIKRRRAMEIGPTIYKIKDKLDILVKSLDKETEPELLKAVKYSQKEFPCILHCLEDGTLDWTNNICERQMRRIATYRNNSLHCGSVKALERFCRFNSIAQSCRMNGKNFRRYIVDIYDKPKTLVREKTRELDPDKKFGLTWKKIVKMDEVKERIVQLLPHKWQDPYTIKTHFALALT